MAKFVVYRPVEAEYDICPVTGELISADSGTEYLKLNPEEKIEMTEDLEKAFRFSDVWLARKTADHLGLRLGKIVESVKRL